MQIRADTAVQFNQPIDLLLPTRRSLLPLSELSVFLQTMDADWVTLEADGVLRPLISRSGTNAVVGLSSLDSQGQTIAIGVDKGVREAAVSSATSGSGYMDPEVVLNRFMDPEVDL